jgi:hypothetical protein
LTRPSTLEFARSQLDRGMSKAAVMRSCSLTEEDIAAIDADRRPTRRKDGKRDKLTLDALVAACVRAWKMHGAFHLLRANVPPIQQYRHLAIYLAVDVYRVASIKQAMEFFRFSEANIHTARRLTRNRLQCPKCRDIQKARDKAVRELD